MFVYVLSAPDAGVVKIGKTKNLGERARDVSNSSGLTMKLVKHFQYPSDEQASWVEKYLHYLFRAKFPPVTHSGAEWLDIACLSEIPASVDSMEAITWLCANVPSYKSKVRRVWSEKSGCLLWVYRDIVLQRQSPVRKRK